MGIIDDIVQFAARQDQVVGRCQAARIGLAPRAFDQAVRRAGWTLVQRGVWLMPGATLTHTARLRAVVLSAPGPALVTGSGALLLHGAMERLSSPVQLLVPTGSARGTLRGVQVIQTPNLDGVPSRRIDGLPSVAVPRAVVDLARLTDEEDLIGVIATAARLRRCSPADIRVEAERRERFPGRGVAMTAVRRITGELSHSKEERYARGLLRDANLGFHSRPYPVRDAGQIIAEVDIARPDQRYGVEVDGPPHLLAEQAANDRARDRRLARHGWAVDRFLWSQIRADPRGFVAEVSAAVTARSQSVT